MEGRRQEKSADRRHRLPIAGQAPAVRPSRTSRWRAAVLISVHLLVALHLAHWRVSGRTLTPLEPSEAIQLSRHDVVNAGAIFFVLTILSTAVLGRFFCGWGCHLVALQDLSRWALSRLGIRPRPLRSKLLALVPVIAFAYMFLWPAAYRLVTGDSFGPWRFELETVDFWSTFPGWIVGALTFLVCGFTCIYFLGAKGFCTYGCPYGAAFAAVERVAPLRIRVTDACEHCGHCTAVCTSNVRVHQEVRDFGMVVDSGCMKCLDCVSVCPNGALFLGTGRPALFARRPSPALPAARRASLSITEEAVLGTSFAVAFFSFRGLYDRVPFLLALGIAGCLSTLALLQFRLARRPDLAWRRRRLKRAGELTPAGRLALAVCGVVLLLCLHSGAIRAWQALGTHAARSGDARSLATATAASPTASLAHRRALLVTAMVHLERVRRWGLFSAPRSLAQLAWVQLALGYSAAEPTAAAALRAGAPAADMQLLRGHALARWGDRQDAIAAFRGAIDAAPTLADGYLSLGSVLAQDGELEAAREIFDRGLAVVGDSSTLLYNRALVDALRGDRSAAITGFEQALAVDPGNLAARENLAGLLSSLGRLDEARELLGRIAGRDAATDRPTTSEDLNP